MLQEGVIIGKKSREREEAGLTAYKENTEDVRAGKASKIAKSGR